MCKLIQDVVAALWLAATSPALSQQGNFEPFTQPSGAQVPAFVMLCASGSGREALPCGGTVSPLGVMQMPFSRSGNGDPIIFSGITTTAKQFEISKPADATAYRFVNPCNVDVRIRKVSSMSESVTPTTGTRFMARSSEVLGTSEPRFVSVIAMAPPTGDCSVELQYGRGS